jgi:hypothetical protein
MGRVGRWTALLLAGVACALLPLACARQPVAQPPSPTTPVVRVRLLAAL